MEHRVRGEKNRGVASRTQNVHSFHDVNRSSAAFLLTVKEVGFQFRSKCVLKGQRQRGKGDTQGEEREHLRADNKKTTRAAAR